MNENAVKSFLQQFASSKKDLDDWPAWMKESAKVASASFPKTHRSDEALGDANGGAEAEGRPVAKKK